MNFIQKYGVVLFGILAILPFLLLSFMNWPIGMHDWEWATNMVGVADQYNYWEEQKYWYFNVMGRYAATAMLSLTNYWFSPFAFKLFSCFQFFFFFGCIYFFLSALIPKAKKIVLLQFSLLIMVLYLHNMQSVLEGFYLLSSNLHYQMAIGITLLFFGCYLKKEVSVHRKGVLLFATSLFAIIVIGMNEISMLILAATAYSIFAIRMFIEKKITVSDVILAAIILIAVLVEVLAPGNYVRMESYAGSKNLALSVGLTIGSGFFIITKWLTTSLLIPVTLLFLPFGIKLSKEYSWKYLNYPIVIFIVLMGIPFLCLFPIFWSMGMETLPDRVVDTIFLFFIIGWFLFVQSLLSKYVQSNSSDFKIPQIVQVALSIFVVGNLFFSGMNLNKDKAILSQKKSNKVFKLFTLNSNIGNAWKDVVSGEAYGYHLAQQAIYDQLSETNVDTLEVSPLNHMPQTIYDEKYDRKARKGEKFMSHLFNKKSIVRYKK